MLTQTEHPVSTVLGGEYTCRSYLPFLLDKTILHPDHSECVEKFQQGISAPCLILPKSRRKMNHMTYINTLDGNWMVMLHTNSSINQPLGAALSNYAIDVYNYVINCITEIPRNILKSVTRQQQRPRTQRKRKQLSALF